MQSTSTFLLIAFWILVQIVPLAVVWVTYKITPNQTVVTEGPLGGLNFKVVGALAAWILTVTLMTSNSDGVFSFIMNNDQSKLKNWTIEGQILLLDQNGVPVSAGADNVFDINKNLLKLTMAPDTYRVENGKLIVTVSGEDMPNLNSFYIAYGSDENGKPLAESFVNLEPLQNTLTGERLRRLHGLVEENGAGHSLKLPFPIILRQNQQNDPSSGFSEPYNPVTQPLVAPVTTAPANNPASTVTSDAADGT